MDKATLFLMLMVIGVGMLVVFPAIIKQKGYTGDGGEDQYREPTSGAGGTRAPSIPTTQKISYYRCGVDYEVAVQKELFQPIKMLRFNLVNNGKIYGKSSITIPIEAFFQFDESGDLIVRYQITPNNYEDKLKPVKGEINIPKTASVQVPLFPGEMTGGVTGNRGAIERGYLGDLTTWSYFATLYEKNPKTGLESAITTMSGTFEPFCEPEGE